MARYIILSLMACIIIFWPTKARAVTINMEVIKDIESSGNVNAYNKGSGAIGLYQITPICLEDYNQYHVKKFTKHDLWTPYINEAVAEWYMNVRIPQLLRHYKHNDSVYNRLVAYNAGIGYVGKSIIPTETMGYVSKYRKKVV